jgi:hypothetical protein
LIAFVIGYLILSLFGLFKEKTLHWLIFEEWNISDHRQGQRRVH